MAGFLAKLLGVGEGRQIKKYQSVVSKINALEPSMQKKSPEELRGVTEDLKSRYQNGASLDELLPEAFAAVREASVRTLGLRHFDVQLMGGMALNDGHIAEMRTGEGKTLVSTLPGYLNAITGNSVHIVTVNDYLARRDSENMGRVYNYLGMTVGLIQNEMPLNLKRDAYRCDVTYGTNAEFGFDYLRDNMVTTVDRRIQTGHHFAIVDEVDSILIDEARTPLIISGAGLKSNDLYRKFAAAMVGLVKGEDFEMDEAKKTIRTTEVGLARVENLVGMDIYDDPSGMLPNYLQQALKAQFLFHRDIDYVVVDGEVKIVDEFTGRIMEGRRFSEGLHQALEAKEHVLVRDENQTLATITLQNYFRMYEKLSGMTGTAVTEDAEFRDIYKLPVTVIPPNKEPHREDCNDLIYRTIEAKYHAVADDIQERNRSGQPVLVGTVSIESSEKLSRLLDKRGIEHEVLNAKHHEREATIVAQAGRYGAVTIATNMAGRGTDIMLGGNPEVLVGSLLANKGIAKEEITPENYSAALQEAREITASEHDRVVAAGGLCVIGTERHESRRIDNQLRGRSGRQGDPGTTQFYLSLEDDLMRLFGGDRMKSIDNMMQKTDMPDDMPIQAKMVSKAIESAQHQVESMHFSARKHVLEYDDVMNLQRQAIYKERNAILDGKNVTDSLDDIIADAVSDAVAEFCPAKSASDDWDMEGLDNWAEETTGLDTFHVANVDHDDEASVVEEALVKFLNDTYEEKREILGDDFMAKFSGQVMLRIIDSRWMTHLQEMDYLKRGIGLRAIGQRDPLVEYKQEAHRAFGLLTNAIYEDFLRTLLRLRVNVQTEIPEEKDLTQGKMSYSNPEANLTEHTSAGAPAVASSAPQQVKSSEVKKPVTYVKDPDDPYANVGRNDLCPCGSGKKFKKCHGAHRD